MGVAHVLRQATAALLAFCRHSAARSLGTGEARELVERRLAVNGIPSMPAKGGTP